MARVISSTPPIMTPKGELVQDSVIEYFVDIRRPNADGTGTRYAGKRTMRATVRVTIDLRDIVSCMGRSASESKGGKCQAGNGNVKVIRVTRPVEVAREEVKENFVP